MPTVTTKLHKKIKQNKTQFTLKQKLKSTKLHEKADTKDRGRQTY